MQVTPRRVRLADGRRLWLRPLNASVGARLIELCQRLSPETRRRRFLHSTDRCDATEAERLAAVGQVERIAFALVQSRETDAPVAGSS